MIGVLEGSVDITWKITKKVPSDTILSVRLFLGTNFTRDRILYEGFDTLTERTLAKATFGERIQATFNEPEFTLTLSNLSFSDALFTFTLLVNTEDIQSQTRPAANKSAKISVVRGIHFL